MPLVARTVQAGGVATEYGRTFDGKYATDLNECTDAYRMHGDVTGLKRATKFSPSPLFTPSPSTHHSNTEANVMIRDHNYLSIRQCFQMLTQITDHSYELFQDLCTLMANTNNRIIQLKSDVVRIQHSVDNMNLDSQHLSASLISPGNPVLLNNRQITGNLILEESTILDDSLLFEMESPAIQPSNNRFSINRSCTGNVCGNNGKVGSAVPDHHFHHFLQHKLHFHQQVHTFLDRKQIAKTLRLRIKSVEAVPNLENLSVFSPYFRLNDNQRYFADRFSCPEYFLDQWFHAQEQRLASVENERKISKADKKNRFKILRESQMMERQRKSQVKQVINWRDLFSKDSNVPKEKAPRRRKSSLKTQLRRDSSSPGHSIKSTENENSTYEIASRISSVVGSDFTAMSATSPLTNTSFSPEHVNPPSVLEKIFELSSLPDEIVQRSTLVSTATNLVDAIPPSIAPSPPQRRVPPPPPIPPPQRVIESFHVTPTKEHNQNAGSLLSSVPAPPPPPPRKSILQDTRDGFTTNGNPDLSHEFISPQNNETLLSLSNRRLSVRFTTSDSVTDRDSDEENQSLLSENLQGSISDDKPNSLTVSDKTPLNGDIDSSDDELDFDAPVRAPSAVLSARASRYHYRSTMTKTIIPDSSVTTSSPPPPPPLPTRIQYEADISVSPADVFLVLPQSSTPRPLFKPPPPPKRDATTNNFTAPVVASTSGYHRLLVKSVRLQTFADVLVETSLSTPGKISNEPSYETDESKIKMVSEHPMRLTSPLSGNIDLLAAIRRGSSLKKKDSNNSLNNSRNSAGSSASGDRTSNGFANSASVQAILERRKYIQAESDSSEDDSDDADW